MLRRHRIALPVIAVAALLGSACEDSQFAPDGDTEVTLVPSSASIAVGATQQFSARLPDNTIIPNQYITWSSTDTDVAAVSGTGLVTGIGAGSARITAVPAPGTPPEVSTRTVSADVTVYASVASVAIAPAQPAVITGQTVQLTATLRDGAGNVLSGRSIAWSSSNSGVASVNGSGLVAGVAAGTARITATSENRSSSVDVTVTGTAPVVASVTLDPAPASVQAGSSIQLTATARDAGGNAISGRTFTWTSSNTGAATVSSTGVVSGVAAGSTTITATTGGVPGSSAVTVTSAPPPGQNRVIFFSDWRTARGNSLAAVTDGGKWDFISADYELSMEIMSSAGLDFPSENVYRVIAEPRRQGWSMPRKNGMPIPAVGESRFYRWYFRSMQPDGLEDYQTHPVQDGQAASNSNWMFININGGSTGVPNGQWQPQFWAYVAPWPHQRWFGPNLNKNQTYRFEVQIHRVSTSQFQMHVRIYDSADRLIADDAAFRNYGDSSTLASNPTFPFHDVNNLDGLNSGNNGIGGNPPFPFTYAYEAAFAVCADTWCGRYNGSY